MPEGMTPGERAELIRRIAVLSDKLDVSETQRKETQRIAKESHEATELLRVLTGLCLGLVGAVVVVGVVFGLLQHGQSEKAERAANAARDAVDAVQASAVTTCLNANKTRAGQRAIWQFFFEVTEAGAGPDAPEAVIDFYHEFLAWIETDVLADRDCDNLDAPIAEPGPPPSYRKALKEALAEEAAD